MRVEVVEMGERPPLFTQARRFAPEGAKVFGEALELQEFADAALVVLDWTNELGTMPDEVAVPVLHVRVFKYLPEFTIRNTLRVDVRLDVEDIFGNDEMTHEVILDTINEMREKVDEQIALRRQG